MISEEFVDIELQGLHVSFVSTHRFLVRWHVQVDLVLVLSRFLFWQKRLN